MLAFWDVHFVVGTESIGAIVDQRVSILCGNNLLLDEINGRSTEVTLDALLILLQRSGADDHQHE